MSEPSKKSWVVDPCSPSWCYLALSGYEDQHSRPPFLVVDPMDEYIGHQPLTILTIGLWLNDRYKKWTDFGLIYLDFGHWTTFFGTKKPDMNDTDCFIDFNDFNWQINKQTQFWLERQLFYQAHIQPLDRLQLTLKKDFVDLRDQKTPETRHRHF